MWRIAPLVVAALGAAGCTAGEPPAFDAGIQDAGPPGVVDAGIEAPSDSGPSSE